MTRATSRPVVRSSTSSRATASTVPASSPYSCEPMSASPESFSRTRPKTGAAGAAAGCTTASTSGNGVPGVVEQLDPALLQDLRHGAGRLVGAVPLLLGQDRLGVE